MARHSPCIGICKLDDATGYCLGCARTGSEIGDWMAMSESQRDAVWAKLPERLASLPVRVRLLPWIREELVDWVRDTIVARQGAWTVGAPGAVAEFPSSVSHPVDVTVEAGVITAKRSDAAFRVGITEKIRAFAFTDGGPIVLGLPRGRASFPSSSTGFQSLGPDLGAIDQAHRTDTLFDVGLGRRYSRFCVRTGNGALRSSLSDFSGQNLSRFMPEMLNRFIAASPDRVVETAAARIEVFSKTTGTGECSPHGAHAQLVPELLDSGDEISSSLALPDYAAPIAIFYPGKSKAN